MEERESSLFYLCIMFLKIIFVEALNGLILRFKRHRKYHFDSLSFRGINIGCGVNCPKNWLGISGGINIFLLKLPKIFYKLIYPFSNKSKKEKLNDFYKKQESITIIHYDLTYGIPFFNETVPYIFSSHLFEHLSFESGKYLLKECFRVLLPGGYVRIVVPSLDKAVADISKALYEYEKGNITLIQQFLTSSNKIFVDSFSKHRYMYNFESMKKQLVEAGFENVTKCNKEEGSLLDISILHTAGGLIVEAKKPN